MNTGMPAQTTTLGRPRRGNRWFTLFLALPLIVVLLGAGWWYGEKYKMARKRAQWKTTALQQLASLSFTNDDIRAEIDELKAGPTPNDSRRWTRDHVVLMTNGEYIVYAYWHGANNGFVDHLFLGHSSSGRWLYSTYHFCNHMAMVVVDDPPGSIAEFAKRYGVREFDGKSDQCLQHTWPPK